MNQFVKNGIVTLSVCSFFKSPVLWRFLTRMLAHIEQNPERLPSGISASEVRKEVREGAGG